MSEICGFKSWDLGNENLFKRASVFSCNSSKFLLHLWFDSTSMNSAFLPPGHEKQMLEQKVYVQMSSRCDGLEPDSNVTAQKNKRNLTVMLSG